MNPRILAALVVTVLAGGAVALATTPHPRPATAHAVAFARDDGKSTPWGLVSGTQSHRGADSTTSTSTSTRGYKGVATARAIVKRVSLLNGMVKARTASVRASAPGGISGRVTDLVVAGKREGSPTKRATYGLQGYGKVIALDTPAGGIVGLTVKLSKPHGRYPRGTVLRVAYASASARDGVAPPPKPKPKPKIKAKPQAKPKPKPPKRRKPSRTHVLLTAKGFVFPVYGTHDYTDTFGAARADTGFHAGNDIFAAAGTPLVAVCDGSLNRVGTLPISGNRLWVKCAKTGDSFFYAHLSAFATDTRDGVQVKAGQVIGFVGSTGDAEKTPPHLHFEVHPGNRAAVDPYPFLRAWENRRDVPAAAWVRANGETGQQPGTLVVVKDFLSR
ncbi:MAG: peptidoglycan LD-endopeptidase LytH [Thermoleophilaceae bacterium]|nr:peptidoglycan LD-endopeptidase LytH [Thermoleophilaceae bacterium]